jgi:hypothetical protein
MGIVIYLFLIFAGYLFSLNNCPTTRKLAVAERACLIVTRVCRLTCEWRTVFISGFGTADFCLSCLFCVVKQYLQHRTVCALYGDLVFSWTVDVCMFSLLSTAEQQCTCRRSYSFFVTDSWTSVHLETFICFLCYRQLNSSSTADIRMLSFLLTAEQRCTCRRLHAFFVTEAEQHCTCRRSYVFLVTDSWTSVHLETFVYFRCHRQLNSGAPADFHIFSLLLTAEQQWTCRRSYAFLVTDSWTSVHLETFVCFPCYRQLNSSVPAYPVKIRPGREVWPFISA